MNNQESAIVPILSLDGDSGLLVISPLGRGAKGVVFLIKEETGGELLALKVILKDVVEKKNKELCNGNEFKRVSFERQVLSHFDHPLLPKLRGVLATEKIIGYAIDFCPGRDLNHLRKQQSERMFSVDIIRFYAAELILALEYLHKQGIAYRDLKPENILIQETGHIMLVDFDLSTRISSISNPNSQNQTPVNHRRSSSKKRFSPFHRCCNSGISPEDLSELGRTPVVSQESTEKSNSFVGTEEYVAPEIIQGYGHDFAVDWWSLGVVLYEMLYGTTPFKGTNRKATFFKILTGTPDLVGETTPLRDLIRNMLIKDPKERIKVDGIKAHEFFKGVDWEMIQEMSRPPYIPPSYEFGGKDGIMKIDVETFVQKIFSGEGENEKKKVDHGHKSNYENNNNNNKQDDKEEKKFGDEGVWVQGLNNHPQESDNFLVF
ncbi:serine/threonine-protein kinase OXI1-like [Mercurialis annua]|uniref:serine/threonine-protein kinase OXI1-like n=1 Tax=Mercurialis annua TaxID=3986 RepID=UPI002160C33D|nr:serine/threonine-protein kinase OXI1-like [Mercurialis annua]